MNLIKLDLRFTIAGSSKLIEGAGVSFEKKHYPWSDSTNQNTLIIEQIKICQKQILLSIVLLKIRHAI